MGAAAYSASVSTELPSGHLLIPMACFISMAMLCTFELVVLVYTKFRRRTGLYFWSIVGAILATALYEWSGMVQYFLIPGQHLWVLSTLGSAGYLLYIVSEFLVLYSRLHLVQASPRTLQIVRSVIITEILLVTIPDTIVGNCALYLAPWGFAASVFRRAEIVIYCTVEIFFSFVYIFHVKQMWSTDSSPSVQRVWKQMYFTNIVIIILEASNVVIEFSVHYALQNCYNTFLFAFKLKIEIWMLNKLTELAQSTLRAADMEFDKPTLTPHTSIAMAEDRSEQTSRAI